MATRLCEWVEPDGKKCINNAQHFLDNPEVDSLCQGHYDRAMKNLIDAIDQLDREEKDELSKRSSGCPTPEPGTLGYGNSVGGDSGPQALSEGVPEQDA